MQTINAADFQARCLAILDEVEGAGESFTILKHGAPVAQVIPLPSAAKKYPQHELIGSVRITGDILEPVLPADAWDAERGEL